MRSYWTRIIIGALAVFGVGLTLWLMARNTTERVVAVVEGAETLSIPLPFDIVPFRVDGNRLGSLQKLVIYRETPKSVNHVRLVASLNDQASAGSLEGCVLSIRSLDNLDEHSTFDCIRGEPPEGMVGFGDVDIEGWRTLPLMVPHEVAAEMRDAGRRDIQRERLRIARRQVEVAEQRSLIAAAQAESLQAILTKFSETYGDSIANVVAEQLEAAAARVRESTRGVAAPPAPAAPPKADSPKP